LESENLLAFANIILTNIAAISFATSKDLVRSRMMLLWRSVTTVNRPTLPPRGNEGVVLDGLHSHDVKR